MRNPINLYHIPMNNFITPPAKKVERVNFSFDPLDEDARKLLIELCRGNRDEVCGFVGEGGGIFMVPNSHPEPRFNFRMQDDLVAPMLEEICKIRGSSVIGVFHTHPTNIPWPSPMDLAGWPNKTLGWRYWIVTKHDVVEWIYHK